MAVKSVHPNKGFIVPIAGAVGKMEDRAVDEYRLRNMEEASTTVADNEPSTERSPSRSTRPSKITSDFESHKEPCPSFCRFGSSSRRNHLETSALKVAIQYKTLSLTVLRSVGATSFVI